MLPQLTSSPDCRQDSSTEDLLLHRRQSSLAASRAIQLLKHRGESLAVSVCVCVEIEGA